jgi:hypothetical protein
MNSVILVVIVACRDLELGSIERSLRFNIDFDTTLCDRRILGGWWTKHVSMFVSEKSFDWNIYLGWYSLIEILHDDQHYVFTCSEVNTRFAPEQVKYRCG